MKLSEYNQLINKTSNIKPKRTKTIRPTQIGKRIDLDNMFFRSSWEANYARYLKWLKEHKYIKDWVYEPKNIKFEFPVKSQRNSFYIPDFIITNIDNNQYIAEIKGYMDRDSRTKLNRMKKFFPQWKIIIINSIGYKTIKNNISKMIPNWEY